jgi:hypothetical protein
MGWKMNEFSEGESLARWDELTRSITNDWEWQAVAGHTILTLEKAIKGLRADRNALSFAALTVLHAGPRLADRYEANAALVRALKLHGSNAGEGADNA